MKNPGHLKVACVHWGQHIEFPSELLGTVIDCPDCGLSTPLQIPGITNTPAAPPATFTPRLTDTVPESWVTRPRKFSVRHLIALGAIAALMYLLAIYKLDAFLGLFGFFGVCCVAVVSLVLYFLPTLVGRNKRNATAIFMLNLLLGWTLLGWVAALVWACTVEKDGGSK